MRMPNLAAPLTLALALLWISDAAAQTPRVRFAAPASCPMNVNCIPGLKRVYRFDPTPFYVRLKVADSGLQALDDGAAEVALAFSTNPQLSRPDLLTLEDDKHMVGEDHIVPIVRTSLLRRHGPALRRRLNEASALLSTLGLRGLNQRVIDGRLPEAVGGEFIDANGLGGPSRSRGGPRIVIGYQAFEENETLAHLYGAALRGAGFRVRVRAIDGLRPETIKAFRAGRIDIWAGYSGSLLGYLKGSSLRRALAPLGAEPLRHSPAENHNAFAMKRELATQLGVSKLSDLARYWAPSASATLKQATGDPRQSEQWAVSPGIVLGLPDAWQLTRGTAVPVAIIDSGARLDHADLGPNIWTNFDEVPGNGVDDDNNGYVDDVHGVDLSSTSPTQDLSDGHGHGTHVAGIVGAAANGNGVVGVAPQARLMIVKVLGADGAGTTGSVAEGIRYAAANGARVINLSLGGPDNDPRLTEAVRAAAAANALVVVAAGNENVDIDQQPTFPAALPEPNLLAVASTDPEDGRNISNYSNYGRLTVQVAAPGASILSSANHGGWELKSGTSMAAPIVAGVAALAISANPQINAVDLRGVLMQNAARSPLPIAAGYVDALHTVLAASSSAGSTTQAPVLKVLAATRKGRRTNIRAAVLGATAAIASYRVTLANRVTRVTARSTQWELNLRRVGPRVRIEALDAAGRTLAVAQRRVANLRKGKGDVNTGGGVRT